MATKNYIYFRWIYLCVWEFVLPTYAQTAPVTPIKISDEDLQPYRNNPDFDYVSNEGISWMTLFWEWLKRIIGNLLEAIFGNLVPESALLFIFSILPYVAIAVLLFIFYKLILKGLLKGYATPIPKTGSVQLTDDEKLIREADLSALQKEALQQKNYRLALRFGYLMVIKKLSENKDIYLAPDKTNTDYLNELNNSPFEVPFSKLTHWYDYVWYGNMPLDAAKYENLSALFVPFNTAKV